MTTTLAPVTPGVRRDFRLLWIGQTSSKLGSTITSVALPLVAVSTLDASAFLVAMLPAATWLPWLILGLPAGVWVDRLPRRTVMIVCDLAALLVVLSVPVAAWLGMLHIAHLLAAALLTGAAGVFFQTAYQTYPPVLLPAAALPAANAKLHGSESAAQVVGPGIGGLVAQLFGAVTGLLGDALSFLVSAICLLRIETREKVTGRGQANTLREVGEGLRFVAADRYLRVLTIFGAVSNIGLIGYQAVMVVFLTRVIGVSPGTVGGLIAVMGLGGVAGAVVATPISRRFGTARGMILCELGGAPFGLLIALGGPGPRLGFVVAGGFVLVAGVVAGNVIKASFRQSYPPPHLLGRVTASMQLVNYGTIPLGALLAGALASTIGVRATMWAMLACVVLAGLILLAEPIRGRRDLPLAVA
ncbi:MFS transporter [Micromonospora sp. CPCC 206061]|uniref:MFS transporter n=1 Tax=Micromonospora sp. CPCC 206061 TaxID=3122410 RepID=UPI002FF04592